MLGLGFTLLDAAIRRSGVGGAPAFNELLNSDVVTSGHSLTDFPIPHFLQRFVEAEDGAGTIRASVSVGSTMQYRWENDGSTNPFQAREELVASWADSFLITEAGPIGTTEAMNGAGSTYDQSENWYREAVDNRADIRFLLYEIWPSVDLDPLTRFGDGTGTVNLPAWRLLVLKDRERWNGIQDHLNAFKGVGEPTVSLVPGGQALAALYDRFLSTGLDGITNFHPDLFITTQPDYIHLNNKGYYFIACCWFASLFQQSPVGLPYALLNEFNNPYPDMPSATLAGQLQDVAWDVVGTHARGGVLQAAAPEVTFAGWDVGAGRNRVYVPGVGSQLVAQSYVTGYPAPTISYQWLVDGAQVGTGATYTPVGGDATKTLTLRAYDAVSGATKTSAGQVVTASPTPQELMLNTAQVGPTLGTIGSGGVAPTYHLTEANSAVQWAITQVGTQVVGSVTLPFTEYRIFGTATSHSWFPELQLSTYQQIPVDLSTSYQYSAYLQLASGAGSARLFARISRPGLVDTFGSVTALTHTPTLWELDVNTGSDGDRAQLFIRVDSVTSGAVVDVRFRVLGEQFVPGTIRQGHLATNALNGGSTPTLHGNLIVNSDFTADAIWTKGTNWSIAAGVATKAVGTAGSITQDIPLTLGASYEVIFTITAVTAGTVTPRLTGGTAAVGRVRSTAGTFTETLVALTGNISLGLLASGTFAGSIDNVSVKRL